MTSGLSFYAQILWMSMASLGAGGLVYGLNFYRRSHWMSLGVAALLGCLISMLVHHFVGAHELGHADFHAEAHGDHEYSRLLVAFAVGALFFAAVAAWFKRRHRHEAHRERPHTHCHHHHEGQEFLHFSGILPHSFFDGLIWGLSLGFGTGLSQQIFVFLLIHRLIETISWMAAFSDFRPRRFFWALLALVGSFAVAALLGASVGQVPAEYREGLMVLFAGSLGYLAVALIGELKEQWQGLRGNWKPLWAICLILGFVVDRFLLSSWMGH